MGGQPTPPSSWWATFTFLPHYCTGPSKLPLKKKASQIRAIMIDMANHQPVAVLLRIGLSNVVNKCYLLNMQ